MEHPPTFAPPFIVALSLALSGCAADVSNYTPPLDPALATPQTSAHLSYCRKLVASQPQPTIWGSVASQIGTSSGNSWVTAAELGTSTAAEAAAGATIVGALLGTHTGLSSRQADAESSMRMCMQNYGEALLEKP